MDFPLSIVPTIRPSAGFIESRNLTYNRHVENLDMPLMRTMIPNSEVDNFLGILEVYVHQARDIHNKCFYQEQDVYAKLFLTTHPESTVSTKIVNKGGRNPIFKEKLSLNVKKFDSSIRCEIWMLSRARNYLDDHLLGLALVPVYEVLHNGKLNKELSLSSSDFFHSPAGFVQLSISYAGVLPLMIRNLPTRTSLTSYSGLQDIETIKSHSVALDNIEIPDPKIISENHQMADDYYFATSPTSLISTLISFDADYGAYSDFAAQIGEHFSTNSSSCPNATPMVTINDTEPKAEVVKQDIVDMYLKSVQQTMELTQMKHPKNSEKILYNSSGARVFYGSRAFF